MAYLDNILNGFFDCVGHHEKSAIVVVVEFAFEIVNFTLDFLFLTTSLFIYHLKSWAKKIEATLILLTCGGEIAQRRPMQCHCAGAIAQKRYMGKIMWVG